jgi:hypothetical protein
VQDAVVGDYNKVTQIFQAILSQPTARPLHQLPPDIADFIALSGGTGAIAFHFIKK